MHYREEILQKLKNRKRRKPYMKLKTKERKMTKISNLLALQNKNLSRLLPTEKVKRQQPTSLTFSLLLTCLDQSIHGFQFVCQHVTVLGKSTRKHKRKVRSAAVYPLITSGSASCGAAGFQRSAIFTQYPFTSM